jgi:hypothetical protein
VDAGAAARTASTASETDSIRASDRGKIRIVDDLTWLPLQW